MSEGGGTTTTNSQPWSGAQPYLLDIMNQARGIYSGQGSGGTGGGMAPLPAMGGGVPTTNQSENSGMFGMGAATTGALLGGPIGWGIGQLTKQNATPKQDIMAALGRGDAISDASWREAGFGPGGASLTPGGVSAQQSWGLSGGGFAPSAGVPGAGGTGVAGATGGGTYADQYPGMSSNTQQALDLTAQRATAGSPLLQTAQNAVQNFAGGGATNNPYLDQMFKRSADQVRDYTNASFTAGGRGGSTTNQDVLGKNIGDLAAQMYGGAYETGQNRQLAAAQMAPGLANQDFFQLQQLLGAGQTEDQYALDKYNAPWQNLQQYSGAVSGFGGLGGTTKQTVPSQSLLPQLLGAGLQFLF